MAVSGADPPENPALVLPEEEKLGTFRGAKRGQMARMLDHMLRIAKREARRKDTSSQNRLRWVNTVAYLTQTYNNLLRDTEVNELAGQVTLLMDRVKKLSGSKHQ